jgi:amino acid adenylation domain-containing protein/non-ribosomal peptide synthase protein (TIGR01720 family)
MRPLVDRLSALSAEQRELLELRLRKQEPAVQQTIPRREQENFCPLSLDQERIWFIQQLDLKSPAYNIYTANRFTGTLDVEMLARSLNEIVRRHEIMRTSFDAVEGAPVQIIAPALTVDIPLIDLRSLSHNEREKEAELIASDLVRRPFDLTVLPLFRSVLVWVDDEAYVCATVFHHIITDWVSFHIFERELALLYEAFSNGRPSPLSQLPIQYADFAVWQRRWLEDSAISDHLDYWRGQLEDVPLILDLPRDRPRPAVQTPWGHRQPLVIPKAHSDAVRRLAQQEGVTLFMALLAVFKVLLFRITGQEKLIVGSPIANRNQVETEQLLGFFINQLALCTDLSGDPAFRNFLHRVRETALGAFAHQEMPFGKLVEEVQPERALSHTPLTQVVFLFLNPQQQGVLKFGNLDVLPYTVDGESSKFDITFSLWDNETGFEGWIEYNTDLFDSSTIIRITEQFRTLLAGIVADPDEKISALPILTETARHQLLVEWSWSGEQAPAGECCVHQLFEAQVELTPEAVAVRFGGEHLSLRELNRRANIVAHCLRRLGIGPETTVGILMKRSPQMIVAMLSVLKAGAAYLPLDPHEPADRAGFMLKDARVQVLLSQTGLVGQASAIDLRVLDLENDWEQFSGECEENPVSRVSGKNAAYLIYTSGSTGEPKGVMVEHSGLANLIKWHQGTYEVKPADNATLLAGSAFDASVWELWPYITAGATIHIPDEETRASASSLIEWLWTEAITNCFLPTPLAEAALEEDWPASVSLRYLLTGGDSLHRTQKVEHPFNFFNHYGPTENTVVATAGRVRARADCTPPSIGRPIKNIRVYLLDKGFQPAPTGVAGELCIGGVGLARGYLNRPDLTAEKFVPNPFTYEPGARLYRTGDLARYRSDGRLEFLGRVDYQVKIRGFRVELGEIEAALNGHGGVRESLATTRDDLPGQKKLVAYVVPEREGLEPADLREFLREKLPDYMVPSAFVFLEKFPLTRNGKIDNKRLPPPGDPDQNRKKTFVAPRSTVERQLSEIWSQVLGVDNIGIHDNFFELGGDSIQSIQIIAKGNRVGLRLAPRHIFLHQTIAELATVAGTSEAVLAEQGVVTGEIPLTPIQHWFFEQNLPDAHHFNQSLLLEVREATNLPTLGQAVRQVFAHHDALHLRFTNTGGTWRQVNALPDEHNALAYFDFSELNDPELFNALETVSARLQQSLDLSAGPLTRAALIERSSGESNLLLVIIHHLAVDGVSWRILLEDLHLAYEQLRNGDRIDLPAKTTSFKRWAERLAEYARTTELEQEAQLWMMSARTRVKNLPIDHPNGVNTEAAARSIELSLSKEETRTLLHEAPAAYRARIDDLLVAALALGFRELTGERHLVVDLEGHGREEIFDDVDLSRTVGWLTAISPVVLDLDEAETTNAAVKLVKAQLRRLPNRGLGYGVLRYLRQDDPAAETLQEQPPAEVSFNYLGQLDQTLPKGSFLVSASAAPGLARSARGLRRYLFEINGSITGGRLVMTWTFSESLHERATVDRLASAYMSALRAIITQSESGEASGYTLSDFPLAALDQAKLDRLVAAYPQLEDIYLLSPIQQGLLYHTLSAPDFGIYTEQLSCELIGDLDLLAFNQAWQQVVDRHSILRTSFLWSEFDEPLQIVHRAVPIKFEIRDWRELRAAEQQERLEGFLVADREAGFDPSSPPLMRLSLFRTGASAYRCVWSHHHLLLDGWSVPLVLNEVMDRYNALRAGKELRSEPPRVFRDYIEWLQAQDQSKAESYWRQALKGFTAPTPLGADQVSAGASRNQEFGDETIKLSRAETEGVLRLARQHQLTLSTLIQGAWAVLLSDYSGMEDVLFGVTASGRPTEVEGIERMVGLFINTLPVRVHLSREASVLSCLKELQARQVEMRQYEYSPLIQQWSDMPAGRQLFESLLVFENYPVDGLLQDQNASLNIRGWRVLVRTRYPLTLIAVPGEELFCNMAYDRRRFSSHTIAGMLKHLRRLLISTAMSPEQTISNLPALPDDERSRLHLDQHKRSLAPSPYVAPRTPVEEMLTGIWARLFGLERVGRHDNFFELGGHSLVATQIISRVREAFLIEFSVRHLFEAMTVARLAERIEAAIAGEKWAAPFSPIQALPRAGRPPLSLAQEPVWLLDQALPGNYFFNVPVAIRLSGSLRIAALERALGEIVDRHEVLRTTFAEVDGEPVQVIAPASPFRLSVVDLGEFTSRARAAEVSRLTAQNIKRPFDLANGPLLRISLLRLSNDEYIALVSMHHIIADAWAVGVFIRELTVLYEAFLHGRPSPLPRLPIQYADYAIWQRESLQGEILQKQMTFWKRQLEGPLEALNLPADYPRTEKVTFKTALQRVRLSGPLTANVRDASRAEGVTLFMLLMTALQVLLHRYTGQRDIRVGTLVANRNRADTEDLIGLFINTLVIRAILSPDMTYRESLRQVRETVLAAFNNQDLPFEQLMQALEGELELERASLIEVLFILQNARMDPLDLADLRVIPIEDDGSPVGPEVTLTTFDLVFMIWEGPDGLAGSLRYKTELFREATIERLLTDFQDIVTVIASQPSQRIDAKLQNEAG